ncbi:hypothetical protein [Paracidobacterium acidisoli]|uniref:Uncharacterized protein n=1 Tax=Paracidobacterium acidisoli TaxID=2303751 RepID=A0A372ILJ3_9BACT|nr:hypothetical protein [Paracidobacterium acidisoli]MBT9332337.1 hypothetical protein [Paracidobacterium acidisoli]
MQTKEEIPHPELHRYAAELRELVEAICASSSFRTSPKSCEFLRHIAENTLGGNIEALKERLIGMTLLGRNATYDTGADAGVRVRANDVRKRLTVYARAENANSAFSIEIPPGTYVPRFFHTVEASEEQAPAEISAGDLTENHNEAPRLSLYRLAMPTLAALFLCTICIRWQMTEEHPFTTFWQDVFQSHRVVLYLPPQEDRGGRVFVDMQELNAAAPLFNLAGQFHKQFTVVSVPDRTTSSGDVLLSLGSADGDGSGSAVTSGAFVPAAQTGNPRFIVKDTATGRAVVDRSPSQDRLRLSGRIALLTIINGAWRSIRIDGTDEAAIGSAIRMLCERDAFPEAIVDSFQKGTITQVVIPMASQSEARVFHEPLPGVPTTTSSRMQ